MQQMLTKNRAWVGPAKLLFSNHLIGEGKAIDIKLGMALMRDRRVPVGSKILSLAGGMALILILEALELPAELWLSLLMPLIGFALSAAIDGLETVLGSFLIAAALLTHIAPREIVSRIRHERSGMLHATVTVTR